jgi:superfamily II DNA/RNA helicase
MHTQYLSRLKISSLNEMQKAAIEEAKKPNDLILLSATGSGKTLAFLLPAIESIRPDKRGVQILIIVPSRELGLQIESVFKQMNTGLKVNCCYGGHSTKIEKNNLSDAPVVLVGTPGRICYHIDRGNLDTYAIHTLILDEFDKSLEFGFSEQMGFIIANLKKLRKKILTSATMMEEIPSFVSIHNPVRLDFLSDTLDRKAELKINYLRAADQDKLKILLDLLCYLNNKRSLVFCNHRDAAERISELLFENKIAHGIFHGGMEQNDRERELIKFRNGSSRILICTDLAARGLDIPEIEAVIHYQLPTTADIFTHRNGRTARMHADGTVYLLLAKEDRIMPFVNEKPDELKMPENLKLPDAAPWTTIYFNAGKKDKINKADLVGMLLQKGKLAKEELGLIEVLDHSAFVAVKTEKANKVLELIKGEKVKNKTVKTGISK